MKRKKEDDMKLKNLLVILVALVFVFAISCKEEEEEEASENTEVKAQEQATKTNVELPEAVGKAIKDNVPDAEIDIMTIEKEGGIALYDIEFKAGKGEIEVAEDGTVMDISTIISMADLPKAAAEAILKAIEGATIKQLEKSEVRAELKIEGEKGTIVRLASPKYVYEAEIVKGGQTGEIQVDPDGKIVEGLKWSTKGEKEK